MTTSNSRKGILIKIGILLLALVLIFSLLAFVGCGGGSVSPSPSPSPKPEEEEVDEAYIKNGSFSFLQDKSDTSQYPRYPSNWYFSSYNNAPSTSSAIEKGIVDTSTEAFNKYSEAEKDKFPKDKDGNAINPGKPKADATDDKVLMINNKTATAGKYSSDSFSVPQDAFAKITISIRTENIADTDGAHINVTGDFEKGKKILFKTIVSNGAWKTYTFYVKGSSLASKNLKLELGLGYSTATDTSEYSVGAVFFDEVNFEFINQAQYNTGLASVTKDADFSATGAVGDDYEIRIGTTNDFVASYDFQKKDTDNSTAPKTYNFNDGNHGFTSNTVGTASGSFNSILDFNDTSINDKVLVKDKDNNYLNLPFNTGTDKIAAFYSPANSKLSHRLYKDSAFEIKENQYYKVSAWVKTTEMIKNTGLNIYLYTMENGKRNYEAVYTAIDTTTHAKDLLDEDNKDYRWQNWIRYSFYVQGSNIATKNVGLEFNFGANNTNTDVYPNGYAFVNDVTIEKILKSEYTETSEGTAAKKVDLTNAKETGITNGNFNSTSDNNYAFNINDSGWKKPLSAEGWQVSPHGISAVGGSGDPTDTELKAGDFSYGIINTNYLSNLGIPNTALTVPTLGTPNLYMMHNIKSTALALHTSGMSLAASAKDSKVYNYYMVSLRIYVGAGANANIYLVDNETKKVITIPNGDKETQNQLAFTNLAYTDDVGNTFASSEIGKGWRELCFIVKNGELAKSWNIEIWNGSRGGATSQGYVFVDTVTFAQIEKTAYDKFVSENADGTPGSYFTTNAKFVDFSAIDFAEEPEEDEDEDITQGTTSNKFDWTLFSILTVSILMIIAMVFVIIRQYSKKGYMKKRSKVKQGYKSNKLEGSDEIDDTQSLLDREVDIETTEKDQGTDKK